METVEVPHLAGDALVDLPKYVASTTAANRNLDCSRRFYTGVRAHYQKLY
jgi:hypothetical protein